jgi:HEAT repeat protein
MDKYNSSLKIKFMMVLIFLLVALSVLTMSCASTKSEMPQKPKNAYSDKDLEALTDLWLKRNEYRDRETILKEFERRRAVDKLIFCYELAGWRIDRTEGREKDRILIINIFGNLKDPKTVPLLTEQLQNMDYVLRTQALDALGKIKDPATVEKIIPLLFDKDPKVRGKAVHTLGEIGDPSAAGHISRHLADSDIFVRQLAEEALKKLGTPDAEIAAWKKKAEGMTLDDLYAAQLTYQKTLTEKEELKARLENETDIKLQLEQSLKERESALQRNEELLESLYESERTLKSKLAQLDIAKQQSEAYQQELATLNSRLSQLNSELEQTQSQTATASVKDELDKTLQKKSELESDVKQSQQRQSVLEEEITKLTAVAEKTRTEAEEAKKEIAAMRNREAELVQQVDELKERLKRGMAPVLVVSKPEGGTTVRMPTIALQAVVVDDKGIRDLQVMLNGQPLNLASTRGIRFGGADLPQQKKIAISEKLQLAYGQNIIEITATDTDGTTTQEIITITRDREHGNVWAAVIGINSYPNARSLKYAVNDALAFKDYLKNYIGLPEEQIFFLTDQEATKDNILSLLGTKLKRMASPEDTVIIFYAGHGAVETDPSNPDGDGFEKYLLPFDADLNDLFASSISMDEVRKIFNRISAERLIFIADTCYSGASGGRTMVTSKTRANLSDSFYERISKGKGRVIISSCSANEISKEDDNLQHGIFSYHMLEGLKGNADQDGDGIITVSELFSYISRTVPEASAQDQHPVKKGETEGELVIGKVK